MSLFAQPTNVIIQRRPARRLEAESANSAPNRAATTPDDAKTAHAPRQILHLRHTAPPDTSVSEEPAR